MSRASRVAARARRTATVSTTRTSWAILTAGLLAACVEGKPPPSGLAFPTTPAEAAALLTRETRRPPPAEERELDAAAIVGACERHGLGALPAGHTAVTRWIQEALDRRPGDAYLLFGTFHDSPGQVDAFRRLVGPGGLTGVHVAAAEQFRADGLWSGVPREVQRGDGALIEAFTVRGDREAFATLARQHRDSDYAAWKLGYEASVLDLLVGARATGVRFAGCDMPKALRRRATGDPDTLNRLRELHCLASLPASRGRHAALLWGQAHLRKNGLARFLPSEATVVSVFAFGQRPGADTASTTVEAGLAKALVVNDPVLVPLAATEAAMLLPDQIIGGQIDRVLTSADEGTPVMGVSARSEVKGTLWVGGRSAGIGREAVSVALPEGEHTYAFAGGGLRIVGAVKLAPGHRVELVFDPAARLTSYVERAAR